MKTQDELSTADREKLIELYKLIMERTYYQYHADQNKPIRNPVRYHYNGR